MSIAVSKILTYYLIQSYLLKKDKSITPLPFIFSWEYYEYFRSSHRTCFMKKAAIKNFAIFTGKWQACRPATLLKTDSNTVFFF